MITLEDHDAQFCSVVLRWYPKKKKQTKKTELLSTSSTLSGKKRLGYFITMVVIN
jgi:pantothenate synthetase